MHEEVLNNSTTLTISSSTLFALAKQSKNLGAFKMARTAYDKLQVCEVCHCHLEDKILHSLFQARVGGGILPIMAYTKKLCPKRVLFSGFRYIKG